MSCNNKIKTVESRATLKRGKPQQNGTTKINRRIVDTVHLLTATQIEFFIQANEGSVFATRDHSKLKKGEMKIKTIEAK